MKHSIDYKRTVDLDKLVDELSDQDILHLIRKVHEKRHKDVVALMTERRRRLRQVMAR